MLVLLLKLFSNRFKKDQRKYFLSQPIINLQNLLPQSIVMATNIDGFKGGFMEVRCISGHWAGGLWLSIARREEATAIKP